MLEDSPWDMIAMIFQHFSGQFPGKEMVFQYFIVVIVVVCVWQWFVGSLVKPRCYVHFDARHVVLVQLIVERTLRAVIWLKRPLCWTIRRSSSKQTGHTITIAAQIQNEKRNWTWWKTIRGDRGYSFSSEYVQMVTGQCKITRYTSISLNSCVQPRIVLFLPYSLQIVDG